MVIKHLMMDTRLLEILKMKPLIILSISCKAKVMKKNKKGNHRSPIALVPVCQFIGKIKSKVFL